MAAQNIASSDNRVVVGLGTTGLSCARYFHARGLPFAIVDTREEPPALEQLRREIPDVIVYTGSYPEELISQASELIVSPGIALDSQIVQKAVSAGVSVIGDIDIFMRAAKVPVIGITGSNAKSTVTELVGEMARAAGLNVGVGGNLGTPALELLDEAVELYVLELSSFQLERAGALNLAVATVLNVSADHLDRHGNMATYRQAKQRIFSGCQCAVLSTDDPVTLPLLLAQTKQIGWRMGKPESDGFGLQVEDGVEYLCHGIDSLLGVGQLKLAGRHNIANALAALALGSAAGLPVDAMIAALSSFTGLPHRCELVSQLHDVRYVNDSKGTNVGATQAALQGLGADKNILLIAGGQGKGADFTSLQEAVGRHCKLLLLMGEDADLLEQALAASAPVVKVASLEEAVEKAAARSEPGDCVLLSPACASFDMFGSYQERGEVFRRAVLSLAEDAS